MKCCYIDESHKSLQIYSQYPCLMMHLTQHDKVGANSAGEPKNAASVNINGTGRQITDIQ